MDRRRVEDRTMAEFTAKHRFARIAPRKARLLMNLIRGRDVDDALTLLRFSKQRASGMIETLVRPARPGQAPQRLQEDLRIVQRPNFQQPPGSPASARERRGCG